MITRIIIHNFQEDTIFLTSNNIKSTKDIVINKIVIQNQMNRYLQVKIQIYRMENYFTTNIQVINKIIQIIIQIKILC